MKEKKITFISNDVDLQIEKGFFFVGYVYLHGKLEKIAGYDLVNVSTKEEKNFLETLSNKVKLNVTVKIKDNTYDAITFLWIAKENQCLKGLIVKDDDIEYLKDAEDKFNKEVFNI